jgi:ubiquinone/menaquinone biosynthesis C-methylase UbiE
VAFADDLPFAADTFDAAISRFGVMVFPSPVDGVREMLRVLKPRRKPALAVWHFAEDFRFDELVRSFSAIVFPFRSFSEQFLAAISAF